MLPNNETRNELTRSYGHLIFWVVALTLAVLLFIKYFAPEILKFYGCTN